MAARDQVQAPGPRGASQENNCCCAVLVEVFPPAHPQTSAVAGLSGDFTFTEMGGRAREVFKMFCS